jgi:beta-ketodecanoyl-[acyl-carrier-protein] synthase
MHKVAISGTGIFTPDQVITNAELVASYNDYASRWNEAKGAAIEAGEAEAKPMSSEAPTSMR